MFRQSMLYREARIVADCEREALQTYVAEYAKGDSHEELLALGISSVITTTTRLPGGNILVTVSIMARKPWECETYPFRLQTLSNKVRRVA